MKSSDAEKSPCGEMATTAYSKYAAVRLAGSSPAKGIDLYTVRKISLLTKKSKDYREWVFNKKENHAR